MPFFAQVIAASSLLFWDALALSVASLFDDGGPIFRAFALLASAACLGRSESFALTVDSTLAGCAAGILKVGIAQIFGIRPREDGTTAP